MLLELTIIGAAVGVALGLRYKVLILVLTIIPATILAAMVGVMRADSLSWVVLMIGVVGSAVQLGYLAGITIRAAAESIGVRQVKGHGWLPIKLYPGDR